jgi:DNA-3-methyladenine glycosylase I
MQSRRRLSRDVMIGHDGEPCWRGGAGATALSSYHDKVWGTRTYHEA